MLLFLINYKQRYQILGVDCIAQLGGPPVDLRVTAVNQHKLLVEFYYSLYHFIIFEIVFEVLN